MSRVAACVRLLQAFVLRVVDVSHGGGRGRGGGNDGRDRVDAASHSKGEKVDEVKEEVHSQARGGDALPLLSGQSTPVTWMQCCLLQG